MEAQLHVLLTSALDGDGWSHLDGFKLRERSPGELDWPAGEEGVGGPVAVGNSELTYLITYVFHTAESFLRS